MPHFTTFHRNPNLHHVRFSGVVTLKDTRRQFSRMTKRRRYAGVPMLVDMRDMTGMDMKLADLLSVRDRLVEVHRASDLPFKVCKISLLVENETAFGDARIFETVFSQAEKLDARIADSVSEALDHLELSESGIAPLIQNNIPTSSEGG